MDLSADHGGGTQRFWFILKQWNLAPLLTIGQFFLIESFVSCTLSLLVGILDYKHSIGATHGAVGLHQMGEGTLPGECLLYSGEQEWTNYYLYDKTEMKRGMVETLSS